MNTTNEKWWNRQGSKYFIKKLKTMMSNHA